jgi:hypothetical protein
VAIPQEGNLLAFDTPASLIAKSSASSLEEAFFKISGRRIGSSPEIPSA